MKQWLFTLVFSAVFVALKIRACFDEKSTAAYVHFFPVKLSYGGKSYSDLQMYEGLPHLMGSCLRNNMKRFKDFQKSSRRLIYLYLFLLSSAIHGILNLIPVLHPFRPLISHVESVRPVLVGMTGQ